jgi:uncharacterized protein YciI
MFYVFLNTNPDRAQISADSANTLQDLHMANITRLYNEGQLIAAGPFDGGGGHFIMLATDSISVSFLLQSDAAITANRFIIEIYPLTLIKGGICRPYEPFEMIEYSYARLDSDTSQPAPEPSLIGLFEKGLAGEDEILCVGWLGNHQSAFVLFNSSSEKAMDFLKKDPLFRKKHFTITPKKLWVGKGTYCD